MKSRGDISASWFRDFLPGKYLHDDTCADISSQDVIAEQQGYISITEDTPVMQIYPDCLTIRSCGDISTSWFRDWIPGKYLHNGNTHFREEISAHVLSCRYFWLCL